MAVLRDERDLGKGVRTEINHASAKTKDYLMNIISALKGRLLKAAGTKMIVRNLFSSLSQRRKVNPMNPKAF